MVIITVMRYINNNSNGVINNYSQKICSCFANHIIKSLHVESKKNRIFYHTKSFIIEIKVVRFKDTHNAGKVAKYVIFSCPYVSVFSLNTGQCGPEKTPYLDTFHAVS